MRNATILSLFLLLAVLGCVPPFDGIGGSTSLIDSGADPVDPPPELAEPEKEPDLALLPVPGNGDADGDGDVDLDDLVFIAERFDCDLSEEEVAGCTSADQDGDGLVRASDVGFVQARLGSRIEGPSDGS